MTVPNVPAAIAGRRNRAAVLLPGTQPALHLGRLCSGQRAWSGPIHRDRIRPVRDIGGGLRWMGEQLREIGPITVRRDVDLLGRYLGYASLESLLRRRSEATLESTIVG